MAQQRDRSHDCEIIAQEIADHLESAVEANLTRADRLRQAVLNEAFKGRLVLGRSNATITS